jgi:adenylate cyclase
MQEIERKFLVDKNRWKPSGPGKELKQGYLSVDPERTVRVRIAGDKAYLTIKGKSIGISRTELEYEIPMAEAEILLAMCLDFVVEKTRYIEKRQGLVWEIDVFHGKNSGLLMAEVELEKENQQIEIPDWVEKEVSEDYCYFNSWLSQNPFSLW